MVTPRLWLSGRTRPPDLERCSVALVGYCRSPARKLRRKIRAVRFPGRLVSHLDGSFQFHGTIGAVPVLALEQVYGGPVSSVIVEELAHFGFRHIVGYGLAGSLTPQIPIGSLVVPVSGAVSDGASRQYAPGADSVHPDADLVARVRAAAAGLGIDLCEGRVWTTDALYRQLPEHHREWRVKGCQLVNMDTSHLYASSRVAGVAAVYLAVVSDLADGGEWSEDHALVERAVSKLHELIMATVLRIGG